MHRTPRERRGLPTARLGTAVDKLVSLVMKRLLTSKILISFAALAALCVLVAFGGFWHVCDIEVRNLSGQTITDVVLEVRDRQCDWSATKRVDKLPSGVSMKVRHSYKDTTAVVGFAMGGRKFQHDAGYVNMLPGERWRLEIQPDGIVKAGYDSKEEY